jgi:hypothetical protein
LHNQSVATGDVPGGPGSEGGVVLRLDDIIRGGEPLPLDAVLGLLDAVAAAVPANGAAPGALAPDCLLVDATGCVALAHANVTAAEAYLAPEQRAGGLPSAAADEYALGMIAYELLTGRPRATTIGGAGLVTISDIDVGPAHVLRPGLPTTVNAVIKRATLRDPASRHGSPAAFGAALARAVRGEVEQLNGPALVAPPRRPRPTDRRGGTTLGTTAARLGMAVAVVGLLLGVTWLAGSLGGVWAQLAGRAGPGHEFVLADSAQVVASPSTARSAASPTQIRVPGLLRSVSTTTARSAGFVRVELSAGTATVLLDGRPVGQAPLLIRVDPGVRRVSVRNGARRFAPEMRAVIATRNDTVRATFDVLP